MARITTESPRRAEIESTLAVAGYAVVCRDEAQAMEVANAIAPGPFPTWMLSTGVGTGGDVEGTDWAALGRTVPRGRVGTPEDVAGTAIFLASRAGAYVVGEVIALDGGIVVS